MLNALIFFAHQIRLYKYHQTIITTQPSSRPRKPTKLESSNQELANNISQLILVQLQPTKTRKNNNKYTITFRQKTKTEQSMGVIGTTLIHEVKHKLIGKYLAMPCQQVLYPTSQPLINHCHCFVGDLKHLQDYINVTLIYFVWFRCDTLNNVG